MAKEVRVKVIPGARREKVTVLKPGVLELSVREEAERGEANERVRQLVAAHFAVAPKSVRIIAGQRSPSKRLSID